MSSSFPPDLPAGPRPRRGSLPPGGRKRRRGLARLLDRSFALRLSLALLAAGALLGAVDRWESCRSRHYSQGCLQADPGEVISVANVESLSIVTAAILFLLEGGQRRQRENLESMEVILSCQHAGARLSYARNDAIERLSERGIWLDGLDLSGAMLDGLHAPHGRWRQVVLREASLRQACLHDADLQSCDLRRADLSDADLRHADLRGADLREARLDRADLRAADLRNARLEGASLEGCQLEGAHRPA